VARHGRRAVVRGFVLLAAASTGGSCSGPRLGVTVSRRVGNAVTRNRIRRRVREWFRRQRSQLPRDLDLVVIGRRDAASFSGPQIWDQLDSAVARLTGGPDTPTELAS